MNRLPKYKAPYISKFLYVQYVSFPMIIFFFNQNFIQINTNICVYIERVNIFLNICINKQGSFYPLSTTHLATLPRNIESMYHQVISLGDFIW